MLFRLKCYWTNLLFWLIPKETLRIVVNEAIRKRQVCNGVEYRLVWERTPNKTKEQSCEGCNFFTSKKQVLASTPYDGYYDKNVSYEGFCTKEIFRKEAHNNQGCSDKELKHKNCPFPNSCNERDNCTKDYCNADVCSNGYAYRMS